MSGGFVCLRLMGESESGGGTRTGESDGGGVRNSVRCSGFGVKVKSLGKFCRDRGKDCRIPVARVCCVGDLARELGSKEGSPITAYDVLRMDGDKCIKEYGACDEFRKCRDVIVGSGFEAHGRGNVDGILFRNQGRNAGVPFLPWRPRPLAPRDVNLPVKVHNNVFRLSQGQSSRALCSGKSVIGERQFSQSREESVISELFANCRSISTTRDGKTWKNERKSKLTRFNRENVPPGVGSNDGTPLSTVNCFSGRTPPCNNDGARGMSKSGFNRFHVPTAGYCGPRHVGVRHRDVIADVQNHQPRGSDVGFSLGTSYPVLGTHSNCSAPGKYEKMSYSDAGLLNGYCLKGQRAVTMSSCITDQTPFYDRGDAATSPCIDPQFVEKNFPCQSSPIQVPKTPEVFNGYGYGHGGCALVYPNPSEDFRGPAHCGFRTNKFEDKVLSMDVEETLYMPDMPNDKCRDGQKAVKSIPWMAMGNSLSIDEAGAVHDSSGTITASVDHSLKNLLLISIKEMISSKHSSLTSMTASEAFIEDGTMSADLTHFSIVPPSNISNGLSAESPLNAVPEGVQDRMCKGTLEESPFGEKIDEQVTHASIKGNHGHCKTIEEISTNLAAFYYSPDTRVLQRIKASDLECIKEIGSGTYGTVYHGKWKGSDVAIKKLNASCFSECAVKEERLVADFWKEAYLLGQLHHPNVVALYGVVMDGPVTSLATVTEYMVNGSLKQVLRRKDRTIDRRKRLIIAMDAAFGMEYLHDRNIIHFDLKSHNFLVNMKDPQRPICKIGDLGLSKVKRRTLISGGVRGTIPWMAPELLDSNILVTEKVDVYSFGIVMWELLTSEELYANLRSEQIIAGIIKGSLRPEIPSWCDPFWRSLMERCWSSDPDLRPSFSDIARELRGMSTAINIR